MSVLPISHIASLNYLATLPTLHHQLSAHLTAHPPFHSQQQQVFSSAAAAQAPFTALLSSSNAFTATSTISANGASYTEGSLPAAVVVGEEVSLALGMVRPPLVWGVGAGVHGVGDDFCFLFKSSLQ